MIKQLNMAPIDYNNPDKFWTQEERDFYKGLSDDERRELEELRAEKARREEAQRTQRERAELKRLKAEQERTHAEAEKDRKARELRERNAKLMEPDDDLRMPTGQKVVLLALAVIAVAIVLVMTLGH